MTSNDHPVGLIHMDFLHLPKLNMAAHRNFLLALLAATFMCIVVLQMSLDGWILRGTVHYTVSVEKKDQQEVQMNIPRYTSEKVPHPNSTTSSDAEKLKSPSSTSLQSPPMSKSASPTVSSMVKPSFEVLEDSSQSKFESPSPRNILNSSMKLQPKSTPYATANLQHREAIFVSKSWEPQNSANPHSNFIPQLRVLAATSRSLSVLQPTPSSSSQVLETTFQASRKLHYSTPPSKVIRETTAAKPFVVTRGNANPIPKHQSQEESRMKTQVQARIQVRSFHNIVRASDTLQRKKPQEFISPQARLQEILKQNKVMQIRSRADPLRSLRTVPTVNPTEVTHVILLTYFRSGSTFVGDLLQQNWKTFYHFEPLHFMTYDSRIRENRLQEVFDLFNGILRCNFSNAETYLKWAKKPHNQFLFTRNIFLWFSCKSSPTMCFTSEMVSAVCQRAPIQVMKVTRLHMRHLRDFLNQNPDIKTKVVYLARDPRGIISSRWNLDWCNASQCSDPQFLCGEMADDIRVFYELQQKEPDRFIQILYEDISLYPEREAKRLFEFLGLPFSLSVQRFLKTHTTARKVDNLDPYSTRRNSSSMAFSWRRRLNFAQVKGIQETCSDVLRELNYTLITSPDELYTFKASKTSAVNKSSVARVNPRFRTVELRSSNSTRYLSINKIDNSIVQNGAMVSNYDSKNSETVVNAGRSSGEVNNAINSLSTIRLVSGHSNSSSTGEQLHTRLDNFHTYDHIMKHR